MNPHLFGFYSVAGGKPAPPWPSPYGFIALLENLRRLPNVAEILEKGNGAEPTPEQIPIPFPYLSLFEGVLHLCFPCGWHCHYFKMNNAARKCHAHEKAFVPGLGERTSLSRF